MKIGLDFDGVITKYPEMFSNLTQNTFSKFFVLTARSEKHREYVEGFLKNYNINVERVMLITEDLNKSHDELYITTVVKEKVAMCKRLKIDVMYEDDIRILNKIKEEVPSISTVLVL